MNITQRFVLSYDVSSKVYPVLIRTYLFYTQCIGAVYELLGILLLHKNNNKKQLLFKSTKVITSILKYTWLVDAIFLYFELVFYKKIKALNVDGPL